MITVKLNGGLGNQMFQYALARALSLKTSLPVSFDVSFFNQKYAKDRPFALSLFNAVTEFSKDPRISIYWALRRYVKSKTFLGLEIYHEKDFTFDPLIFNISENAFVEGFFQSEKYFKEFEAQIRADFTFKNPPDALNLTLAEEIKAQNAVSVHIRRGDYVNKPRYKTLFSHCDLEYYTQAMDLIASKVENPFFYFFSDEPQWVSQNLKTQHPYKIISHNTGEKSPEDMRLMSLCSHNIIANSSFSWWGAWLNSNPAKVVVCPKNWFAQSPTPDIYPEQWRRI